MEFAKSTTYNVMANIWYFYSYNQKVWNAKIKCLRDWCLFSTVEPMTNWKNYNEDQRYQNSQYNQLDLHVLQPHLPTYFGPWIPKVLCLKYDHLFPQKMAKLLVIYFNNKKLEKVDGKRSWQKNHKVIIYIYHTVTSSSNITISSSIITNDPDKDPPVWKYHMILVASNCIFQ